MMTAQGYTPDNSITSAKIVNDTIINADINAAAAISVTKLSGAITQTTGNYAGNGTSNRAIAHNLPFDPKLIIILTDGTTENDWIWMSGMGTNWKATSDGARISITSTPDGTNFYVGNATFLCNENAKAYKWIAFG